MATTAATLAEIEQIDRTKSLDTVVRQVRDLPALPEAAMQVMRLTENPKSGTAEVAKALVSDQALAARVLKLANSAFYGSSRRVGTVSEGVVILGMRTTRNLVLAASCEALLEQEAFEYGLPRGALLRHSLLCASAAQTLAKRTQYCSAEEAFVAGLLHDVGKVVMNAYLRPQFTQVLVRTAGGETYPEAEQAVFGFDHAEAGACLLERWHLPASLVAAVQHHHAPLQASGGSPLPCLVHTADAVCRTLATGPGWDGTANLLQPEALAFLGLTAEDFGAVASQTRDLSQSEPLL